MLNKGLIVSCQALQDEPLHSSYIMSRMAVAAKQGGAVGIRANSKEDILAIKKEVDLPVIGIVKRDYKNSDVYITATINEIDELLESGCEVIALDATISVRPKETLEQIVQYVRDNSNVQIMADISTLEEAKKALDLGFDYIGTTLVGYTVHSNSKSIYENDYKFMKELIKIIPIEKIIAEGKIETPEILKEVKNLGVEHFVVGSAITRPQLITKKFSEVL